MPPVCARRTRHVDERTRWQGRASGSVTSPESRSMDSGFGSPEMAIPAPVLALAHGCPVRVVWHNGVGGVTCEYGQGDGRRFVKWSPSYDVDLAGEAARLDWAGR